MYFCYTRGVSALVFGALLFLGAAQAQAHALYAAHSWQGTVALVQFAYAGGEVPTYAKVEVYSPADAKVEFQNGRTDAQGRFAFMPDAAGQWRIIMADNMGHRVEHTVEVAADQGSPQISGQNGGKSAAAASPGVGGFSVPLRIVLGLSLLANLALGAVLLRRSQKQG
ncbi:MAG: hypothetical protein F8N36_15105 [Desulfovibrio sp.]|uniref:hypothetical protein n=1 Tax=Desulfovibrio sp. TaxID=885 RepID=UPI00135D2483|nr:hypothetical protein [Desulfovibrio sp.]MTJ94168.1 hypothetical protein [Desulfovibrio sp.]